MCMEGASDECLPGAPVQPPGTDRHGVQQIDICFGFCLPLARVDKPAIPLYPFSVLHLISNVIWWVIA